MKLNGKVALVLGAIKGIGKGIGLALAEQGVKVALNYFDWEEELEGMKKDFRNSGGQHLIIQNSYRKFQVNVQGEQDQILI